MTDRTPENCNKMLETVGKAETDRADVAGAEALDGVTPPADGPAVVTSVNTSERKTVRKKNAGEATAVVGHGLDGDAHAGGWHRQVSLLAEESIEKMRQHGLDVGPGDFAENLTTRGIDIPHLPIGTKVRVGDKALLEITQIGKECHTKCAIYYQAGDCIMPREGIFAIVLKGGKVKVGDKIVVEE